MTSKIAVLVVLIVMQLSRALFLMWKGKNVKYLLVSFFIISVPFHFYFPVFTPGFATPAGTLGTQIYIYFPLILLLISLPFFRYKKYGRDLYHTKSNRWIFFVLLLILLSLINPVAPGSYLVCIFLLYFASHILFFQLLLRGFNQAQIIKGVYDGLFVLCLLQLPLAVCFPVLHLSVVTTIFHAVGEQTATRMGSRPGAIGSFLHPGMLALFTIIASVFFQACYLNGYNKKKSGLMLLVNVGTLVLTFSRTAYLVFALDLVFIYFIFKNAAKPLFSMNNVLKFVIPTVLILAWLVFLSPLSSIFLQSDSDDQYENRMIHWRMAEIVFSNSPWMGVGLNSHLEYISSNFFLFKSMSIEDIFFWKNPIHNIHLLILVETGIIGLLLWFIFCIGSIFKAKTEIAHNRNQVLSLTHIGIIVAYLFYGITGWAPLSDTMLAYFFFFSFFTIKFRNVTILPVEPQNGRENYPAVQPISAYKKNRSRNVF